MQINAFFDENTYTMTYIVSSHSDAIIIDPVLDFDAASVSTSTRSLSKVVAFIHDHGLHVHYILETHAHADHLSGAYELIKKHFPDAKIGIGAQITKVQKTFKNIFHLPTDFQTDGSQFGRLFQDNEQVTAGSLHFKVLYTPGHTPACVSYLFEGAVFTGDVLFMPDYGTGRCDFPDGDAKTLYESVTKRLYTLPEDTRVFVGHDYQPGGRALAYETTIGLSKKSNIQLNGSISEQDFVDFRQKRDASLSAPKLLYPSIQINIAAGCFPEPEANGVSYLKLPLRGPT